MNYLKESGNSNNIGTPSVRGKVLSSKGINKNAKYIEDAEGNPVDGWKLQDMRSHARAIWANFKHVGRAPSSWGKADAEIARVFRHEMGAKFFEFTLCENNWKADQLATGDYPSWYNNHVKGIEVKEEVSSYSDMPALGSKRPAPAETAELKPKKAKKVLIRLPIHAFR